jgi:hypothetical protein
MTSHAAPILELVISGNPDTEGCSNVSLMHEGELAITHQPLRVIPVRVRDLKDCGEFRVQPMIAHGKGHLFLLPIEEPQHTFIRSEYPNTPNPLFFPQ